MTCVYAITNLINGKRYIGSATDFKRRSKRHIRELKNDTHWNPHLRRAWEKYGHSAFKFVVLSVVKKLADLLEAEQAWISGYSPEYNINPSSTAPGFGKSASPKTRKLLSDGKLGPKNPMFGKCGPKHHNFGKHPGPETIKKLRAAHSGLNAYWFGKKRPPMSAEQRSKIGAAFRGRKLSDEHKAKISAGLKGNKYALGYHHTPGACAKISASLKGNTRRWGH